MMLRMGGDGSEYESWEGGRYIHEDDEDFDDPSEDEYDRTDDGVDDSGDDDNDDDDEDEDDGDDDDDEDAFDVHAHAESGEDNNMSVGVELDPAFYPNDEAYARALQDAEDREMAARLLALTGINERECQFNSVPLSLLLVNFLPAIVLIKKAKKKHFVPAIVLSLLTIMRLLF